MKTTKTSHETKSHPTHEGDTAMKTTKPSHETKSHHPNPGDTTMKTTTTHEGTIHATMHATPDTPEAASTTPAPAATSSAAGAPTTTTGGALGYIATCMALLAQIEAAFPQENVPTAKQKKRQPKARKGGERFTPQLVALAQEHGVSLKTVPLESISSASAEASALVPLQKRIASLNATASARMFALQSTTWSSSSKLYSVMKRLSKDDGKIEAGLAPVEHYFNHRHPLVAKNHPKTKRAKAEMAAEKKAEAQAAASAPTGSATQGAASPPPAAPVTTTVSASPAPVATNGAPASNGAAHS